jgi:hypothetical protein
VQALQKWVDAQNAGNDDSVFLTRPRAVDPSAAHDFLGVMPDWICVAVELRQRSWDAPVYYLLVVELVLGMQLHPQHFRAVAQ